MNFWVCGLVLMSIFWSSDVHIYRVSVRHVQRLEYWIPIKSIQPCRYAYVHQPTDRPTDRWYSQTTLPFCSQGPQKHANLEIYFSGLHSTPPSLLRAENKSSVWSHFGTSKMYARASRMWLVRFPSEFYSHPSFNRIFYTCRKGQWFGKNDKERMVSFGMLRRVALVWTNVSEELSAFFIRVTRIGELGTTLA
jgi:hypothetical protein